MNKLSLKLILILVALFLFSTDAASQRFEISYPASSSKDPLDGRLLLLISTNDKQEPRFQISEDLTTQQVFGVDVDGWKAGQTKVIDKSAFGYPLRSLAQVPAGEYWVQALLHKYETFRRSDGHTVKLPMDRGEGQQWNRAPGNLYSTPRWVTLPSGGPAFQLVLDQEIPPIADPPETRYVKHERIQSRLLSEFWGRPMYLGAHVLLPEGFDTHPQARYPLVIYHGHFPYTFEGFREEPPDMRIARLGDRPAPDGRSTGVFRGNEAEIGH